MTFNALVLQKDEDGKTSASVQQIEQRQLPEGDVVVKVDYSTLNYKDSLAITGASPVVRHFPMVPGIDLAGSVERSDNSEFKPGDEVLLNGWGVGETHWGGLAQKACLKSDWLMPLPTAFTSRQAMAIGTAGYTAMLAVIALERQGVTPTQGEIIVSGAAGGVGSIAIAVLTRLGYTVIASTGRPEQVDYLKALGAADIIARGELSEPGRPLARERWAGAIDTVGSHTLANICAATRYGGAVIACGLAQGSDFPATVMPFILRGVALLGIDSVYCPRGVRIEAWARLARELEIDQIESMISEISLSDTITAASRQLSGQVRGRSVVDVNR